MSRIRMQKRHANGVPRVSCRRFGSFYGFRFMTAKPCQMAEYLAIVCESGASPGDANESESSSKPGRFGCTDVFVLPDYFVVDRRGDISDHQLNERARAFRDSMYATIEYFVKSKREQLLDLHQFPYV